MKICYYLTHFLSPLNKPNGIQFGAGTLEIHWLTFAPCRLDLICALREFAACIDDRGPDSLPRGSLDAVCRFAKNTYLDDNVTFYFQTNARYAFRGV